MGVGVGKFGFAICRAKTPQTTANYRNFGQATSLRLPAERMFRFYLQVAPEPVTCRVVHRSFVSMARIRPIILLLWLFASGGTTWAGGSGLNVLVVVNQNSTNSVQLGNYYCEQRGVPPQNLLRINWPGGNTTWTLAEFESSLRLPLTTALANRQLTNQIDFVVLGMDIPYRITNSTVNVTNNFNSTTAALFYGFKDNPADPFLACTMANGTTNLYAGSESIFRATPPISATSNSWLTFLLTATNLTKAKALVDLGVASDATFPTQTVFIAKTFDVVRRLRYLQADNVIQNTRLRGNYRVALTNISTTTGLGPLLGFQNGVQVFTLFNPPIVPGAMVDNLTSFGGFLFEPIDHTTAMDFINHGATASYGTVTEPCAYPGKFPAAQNYFYQARGFSIAECYYQSLTNPYQGILVGEPLAAPFALPAHGAWNNPPENAVLSGTTNLSIQYVSDSITRPVQQVDLFLNGQLLHTVSNMPPRQNNILSVTLNGFTTNYTVPANATLAAVTSNLVLRLNANAFSNATKVAAFAHGDRIELQSMSLNTPGSNVAVSATSSIGSAALLTSFISASRSNFLDTPARGIRQFTIVGEVVTNDYLQMTVTRTNGLMTTISVTNTSPSSGNIYVDMQIFAQSLVNAINANVALTGSDGVIAEDLIVGATANNDPAAVFNLRARAAGWHEAQIQAHLTGSFSISPTMTGRLEDNLADLRPRNHLYLTAGLTNWTLSFPFQTTTNADGYHELTAVAYEGSHVRTQTHIRRSIRIQNNPWSATFTTLLGDTNTALEATLQFAVAANTSGIARIELFSTGGSLGASNNVTSATFAIPAAYLGIGRHPFYAVVTHNNGTQYRTETRWMRIIGAEPPFKVAVLAAQPTLAWPATAGRSYQILSTTSLVENFGLRAAVTPTNSWGQWTETNHAAGQQFYRVKTP